MLKVPANYCTHHVVALVHDHYRWQRVLYPRILISQTRTREENPLPVPVPATRHGHQLVPVPATRGNGLPAGIRQPQETDTIQYIVQNIKQY